MKSISATDARANLSDIISRVRYGKEFIALSIRGEDSAVLVHPDFVKWAFDQYERAESLDAEAVAARVKADPDDETIPWEQAEAELDAWAAKRAAS